MEKEKPEINITYDASIEVTEKQYWACIKAFPGVIATRYDIETKKYYIKVWVMKYAPYIKQVLNSIVT